MAATTVLTAISLGLEALGIGLQAANMPKREKTEAEKLLEEQMKIWRTVGAQRAQRDLAGKRASMSNAVNIFAHLGQDRTTTDKIASRQRFIRNTQNG